MKIVMVIDSYNEGNGGCVATKRLSEGLRKRGHQVSIVTTGAGNGNIFTVKGTYLPFIRESLEKMQFLFGIPQKNVLRKAFADADVVQIQFPFYLGYGAVKMALAMKKNVIGTFHVQPQNIIAAMGKENVIMEKILIWFFNFFLLNRAPVIQCPSQFAADLLRKNGSKKPARVVSNGIPEDYVPKKFPRPEWFGDNMVIMNVGRQALEKRHALLIEGVKRSKYAHKIQLLLCGKGELSEKLIAQGSKLPVKPMIRYVTHEEKLQYLNTADMFVHASIVELESLACLEAIGCGLPCLIANSQYSAAPQFALDSRFTFTSDDATNLAEKINYWFEHKAELAEIRTKVLAMAEHYRFETCLDKMEALYREGQQGVFGMKPAVYRSGPLSEVPA
jgi:1,2-diacylglycerol 3-alpha-glucosyltransferase